MQTKCIHEDNTETLDKSRCQIKRSKHQIVLSGLHKNRKVSMWSKWIIEDHNWNVTICSDKKRFSMGGPDNWSSYVMPGESSIKDSRQCKSWGFMIWLMKFLNSLLAYRLIRGKFKSVNYIAMIQDKLVPCMKWEQFLLSER